MFSIQAPTFMLLKAWECIHYKSISRGVLDSTDLLYFLVVCTLFLYLTVRKLKLNKLLCQKRPLILITNDDGDDAKGIRV